MASKDLVHGASKSLNKTISEIMRFLGDNSRRQGGKGTRLRDFLHEKIADFGTYWYKRGVRRGHMESYKEFKKTGEVAMKFHYEGKREFFRGLERRVRVTSKIKMPTTKQGRTKGKSH